MNYGKNYFGIVFSKKTRSPKKNRTCFQNYSVTVRWRSYEDGFFLWIYTKFRNSEILKLNKALAVVPLADEPSLIIGADTVVVIDNKILGKPKDEEDAFKTLRMLSGRTHIVVTGIAVVNTETNELKTSASTSKVTFEELTDEQIRYYINNYKPLDKAGSYGIQEMPDGYIKSYTGRLDNIIGLDVEMLKSMLN